METEGRIIAGEDNGGDLSFAAFSVGMLYFFSKQNISPYVGAGMTAGRAWRTHGLEVTDQERGMGVYAAGGLQMLRTTQNRLKLELRVDRPFYSLPDQDVLPVTIGLFFSRHYVPGGRSGCMSGCLF